MEMQTPQCIDSVWRNTWTAHPPIRGVFRESEVLTCINGVWRSTLSSTIDLSTLLGFRIVYMFDDRACYESFPWLRPSRKLPVVMHRTGEHKGCMDLSMKGVLFEYGNEFPYEEGICVYRGTLYAEFPDDVLIPVNPYHREVEPWSSFRLADLNIQMRGYLTYETYGYYTSGWNTIFQKEHFMDMTEYPDKTPHKNTKILNIHNISPVESRDASFSSRISIGIARNLRTPDRNMVGSSGILDHTYRAIYVDGEPKPFVIDVYH